MGEGVGPAAALRAAPHPVVDLLSERRAIALIDRSVVALTSGVADAVARFPAQGRLLTLVTGPHARLTLPVRELASLRALHWVVQTGPDEYFDGMSGQLLDFVDGDFRAAGIRERTKVV